ncbi:hypothetical protein B0H19DRAFT_1229276 [Mycena capillaripes]|nr:hypothetical protein B0H19DRAFT_1229276 [Mycena capillaripes]
MHLGTHTHNKGRGEGVGSGCGAENGRRGDGRGYRSDGCGGQEVGGATGATTTGGAAAKAESGTAAGPVGREREPVLDGFLGRTTPRRFRQARRRIRPGFPSKFHPKLGRIISRRVNYSSRNLPASARLQPPSAASVSASGTALSPVSPP